MSAPNITALTGLRAVAAAWVLAFHTQPVVLGLFPSAGWLRPWMESGFLGVDLFFVLSGYVIALNYTRRLATGAVSSWSFLNLRLARIYPLHVCWLGVLVLGAVLARPIGCIAFAGSPLWKLAELPAQIGLIHSWGGSTPAWNVPSWSISCEWFGYLVFARVGGALLSIGNRLQALALGTTALATSAVVAVACGSLDITYSWGLARFAGEFSCGALLWRIRDLSPDNFRFPPLSLWLLAVATLVLVDGPQIMTLPLLAGCVMAGADPNPPPSSAWLESPVAQYLGRVSYAFYMTQAAFLLVSTSLVPFASFTDAAVGIRVLYLISLVLGAISLGAAAHHLVELPARRRWIARSPGLRRSPTEGPAPV